uniref:Uncharacterized protein n=1 Tax=viral metagenome TaxID=1070528 RepID=A0A6C0JYT8_9ZZZZ
MDIWVPIVIGTVAFAYIQSYNRIATLYLRSQKTLSWNDFFTTVIPLQE